MGMLNTFLIAAGDDQAASLASPMSGPDGFDSAGMTEIELDTLLAVAVGVDYASIAAVESHFVGRPGEQWLMRALPERVTALVGLSPSDVDRVGQPGARL